jgi:hypothetical protein
MWKSNNTFPNNQWAKEKNQGEIKKYLEISKNENTAYYNS